LGSRHSQAFRGLGHARHFEWIDFVGIGALNPIADLVEVVESAQREQLCHGPVDLTLERGYGNGV
jgi:hypothetical protein